MVLPANFAALGRERFISLTTFRRSGEPVATPVWVVREGDQLLVLTPSQTGKVKRLRRNSSVQMRPCSRRGAVADTAPTVRGVATVSDDPDLVARVRRLLKKKYGLEYRLFMAVEAVVARGVRSRCVLVIDPDTRAVTCWPT